MARSRFRPIPYLRERLHNVSPGFTVISLIRACSLNEAAVAGRLAGKELTAGVAVGKGAPSDHGSAAPVGVGTLSGSVIGGIAGLAAFFWNCLIWLCNCELLR